MSLPLFLDAPKRLNKSACPSVGPSVGPSVRPSVMLSLFGLLGATYAVYTRTALFIEARSTITSSLDSFFFKGDLSIFGCWCR